MRSRPSGDGAGDGAGGAAGVFRVREAGARIGPAPGRPPTPLSTTVIVTIRITIDWPLGGGRRSCRSRFREGRLSGRGSRCRRGLRLLLRLRRTPVTVAIPPPLPARPPLRPGHHGRVPLFLEEIRQVQKALPPPAQIGR